jgi:hypothetical protein
MYPEPFDSDRSIPEESQGDPIRVSEVEDFAGRNSNRTRVFDAVRIETSSPVSQVFRCIHREG